MSNAKTPAYPRPIGHNGLDAFDEHESNAEQAGVDVRHYFAARAPSEPAAWFQPEPLTPRPHLPAPEGEFSEAHCATIDKWMRTGARYSKAVDVLAFPEAVRGALLAFQDRVFDAQARQEEWDREQQRRRAVLWPFAWAEAVLGVDVDIREQLARYKTVVRLLFEFQGHDVSLREAVIRAGAAAAADYSDGGDITLDKCEQAVAIGAAMAALTFVKAGAEDGRVAVSGITLFVEQAMQELAGAVNSDRAATLSNEATR